MPRPRAQMRRRFLTPAICAVLGLAGCGSSSGTSASSSSVATAPATRSSSASGGQAPGLKATTTPKFAPAAGPIRSGTVQIAYRNIAIAPDALRVKVGSKLVWTNYDDVEHNVTSEGGPRRFASKSFGQGGTFSIVASHPGTIHYECTNHPTTMNGTIEVIG